MYIIDFDDTLFDTYRYKLSRMERLHTEGVSEELFWQSYKKARNNDWGAFTYSDKRHAEVLSEMGFNEEKIFQALNSVNTHLPDFLFEDTLPFLEDIKKKNEPMVLLSLGDPETQEMKVQGSGVHRYFDRTFMVQETKEQVVQELLQHYQKKFAWFINDKVKETQLLQEKFPELIPVLHQSPAIPEEEYKNSKIPHFLTLTEILKYVESHS